MKICKYLLFITILIPSCNIEKKDSLEYKIRGDDFKYWILVHDEPMVVENHIFDDNPMLFLYFDKSKKFYRGYKNSLNTKFVIDDYLNTDMVVGNDWLLTKDSIITMNGAGYKIKEITNDMMLLYDQSNNRYSLYVIAPANLIPKEFYRLQSRN